MKDTTYIISHIPKTAGTTIRRHLKLILEDQKELIHLANRGKEYCQHHNMTYFTHRTDKERKGAKVIIGHDVNHDTKNLVASNKVIEIVSFREPSEWEISRYNQHVNRMTLRGEPTLSFKEWIKATPKFHSQFDWFIANYLNIGGRVKFLSASIKSHLLFSVLNQMDHVYLVSQTQELISSLISGLNLTVPEIEIQNQKVVGNDRVDFFEQTDENLDLLNSTCEADNKLFQIIKKNYIKY